MISPFKQHWNKFLLISVALHIALLSIPISMVAKKGIDAIEISLITQENPRETQQQVEKPPQLAKVEPPKPLPPKPEPIKPEPLKTMRLNEKPPAAMRPEEPKDVKAQIVSPGQHTVMNVAPGVGDAVTGVAIAGGKVGSGGTAIGGSMPGGTGTGTKYGYGGEGKGPIDGRFGGGDGPRFAYREMPEYPSEAKRLRKEGRVVLQVTIDGKGKLEGVDVLEVSDRLFVESALDSIRKSRFVPAKKDGVPFRCRCKLVIKFALET